MAAADDANQARLDAEAKREAEREAARQKRMDELKAEREKRMAEEAAARAASDPMKNPTERPEAPPADDKYVYYYSWIGGVNSGSWKLYREPVGSPKADEAEARSEGGKTTATFNSSTGANTLASNIPGGSGGGGSGSGGSGNGSGSTGGNGLPAGFTSGPFPSSLEKLFGSSAGYLGYKVITNPDGSRSLQAATGPNSWVQFGANFTLDNEGNFVPFVGGSTSGRGGGAGGGGATTYTAPDGRIFTDLNSYNNYISQLSQENKTKAGQSAYDFLFSEFNNYGMGALVEPLKQLITEGYSAAELRMRLRDTDAYKKRFAANAARIQKGLAAIDEATYIGLEDKYQEIMRQYGLPESYYSRGDMGRQEGFEKFIANDIAPTELEDRIITAQNRVLNAAPEIGRALRDFYPDITNGDILAYALDPQQAITNIKRKVTAAEIGGAALASGLATDVARAERLRAYGVTGEQAREGYQQIASVLPRASVLGDIYAKQGLGAYDQATAETERFGTPGAAEAGAKRRKLAELEQAQFGGSSGRAGGALARERAGQFQAC